MKQTFETAATEAAKQIADELIQGVVFGIVGKQSIIALGKQCIKPCERMMTEHSRFDIASVGKVFTAGCCALLTAEGKLNPDAPFTEYLPEHILGQNCNITIRDLAMHVSGFDNSKPYDSVDSEIFNREILAKCPVRGRLEAFEYSCYNMILLGKIVERLSGLNLDGLARKLIWKPLGMHRTQWFPPGDGPDEVEHWLPNRTVGQHNDNVCYNSRFPLGSGSCFSTAGDMLLFAQDILERKCFPKEYYDMITTCKFEKDGNRRSFGWDMSAGHRPEKLSDKTIFHSGWTGQSICIDPENNFAAVVLTSRTGDWDEAYKGRIRIIEKLYSTKNKK